MLTIRSAQRRVLQQALRRAFARELLEHVRLALPVLAAATPPALLARRVAWALARALQLGLGTRLDLQSFAVLALGVGPAIESHPVAAEVFASAMPAERKIDVLISRLTPADWQSIRALSPPDDWPQSAP